MLKELNWLYYAKIIQLSSGIMKKIKLGEYEHYKGGIMFWALP